jgi:glutamyl-tRNA reductase
MDINGFKLALVGISHKTADVEVRENFQISKKLIPDTLKIIRSMDGVEGILVVSTCNRLEFYLVIDKKSKPFNIIGQYYLEQLETDINNSRRYFYILEGDKVTSHLFRVISGLDSLVIGEYQIQGQMRDAYSMACEYKTVDKILHKLFHAAFRTGKNVRSQTSFGQSKQSVSGVAAEIIIQSAGKNSKICIIGVNENTKIIASSLTKAGFHNFHFANRTLYKAEMMVQDYGGNAVGLDNLPELLPKIDVIYSSTGAPGFIINSQVLKGLSATDECPELIIDMAVPRDIDTEGLPPHIKCLNLNDLEKYLSKIRQKISSDIPEAEKIIKSELDLFKAWTEAQGSGLLEGYSEKFEAIRQQLIDESSSSLTGESLKDVDKITRRLVHRLQSEFIRVIINMKKES